MIFAVLVTVIERVKAIIFKMIVIIVLILK